MAQVDCKFKLATHGDSLEMKYWGLFVEKEFPSYGRFWEKNIAPITKRDQVPYNIRAKDDKELEKIGKSKWDVLISQLHYSVLAHLVGAYEIIHRPVDRHGAVACFGRLCGAVDVADELIQRWTDSQNKKYHKWSRNESENMRNNRRNQHPHPLALKQVAFYRNALMHGQVMPGLISQHSTEWLPNLNEDIWRQYQDWRTITNRPITSDELNTNFTEQKALLEQAWNTVIKYLESNWKDNLLT